MLTRECVRACVPALCGCVCLCVCLCLWVHACMRACLISYVYMFYVCLQHSFKLGQLNWNSELDYI